MQKGKHWVGTNQGLPALFVEIDDKTAILDHTQKLTWLEQFGAVFLGSDFQDDYSVTAEIEGRTQVLEGFTQDETIVKLYREFLEGRG